LRAKHAFALAITLWLVTFWVSAAGTRPRAPGGRTETAVGAGDLTGGGSGGEGTYVELPDGCTEGRILQPDDPPMRGEDVAELQGYLKALGLYDGPVDGVYGAGTARAVGSLQARLKMPVTGIYDSRTWVELEGGAPAQRTGADRPTGKVHIRIDLNRCRLTVYSDGSIHKSYTVAIGKSETPSPVGEFKVVWKGSGWGGGFGSRWLGLNVPWGTYGIHGTNRPWTIGQMASQGCFRMFNHDVEEIFPWIDEGTPVFIEGDLDYSSCREVMRRGDAAQDVVMLQFRLKEKGFYGASADGDFGPATEDAVRDMQLHFGLEPSGVTSADLMRLLGL
jgi:peptidoglycan hydrolase-like protein with peptidoglycan-binding domain